MDKKFSASILNPSGDNITDPKFVEVAESLSDVMESVKSVHGESFSKFVIMMTTVGQIYQRITFLAHAARDQEHSEEKERSVEACFESIPLLLAALSSQISDECGIDADKVDEGLEWAARLVEMMQNNLMRKTQ
jgi:hypothetical protein